MPLENAQADSYSWSGGTGTWTRSQSAYRIEHYNGVDPGTLGPTQGDSLTLINAGSLQLQNSGGSLAGGLDREIDFLSSSVAGGNISAGTDSTGGITSITVLEDLNLSVAGASLTFWNQSSNPTLTGGAMTATVAGNVNIGAGTSLYLGLIQDTDVPTGSNYSNFVNSFTANSTAAGKGQINVGGKLMLNRNTTNVTLGDVNLGAAGVVTLTGAGVSNLAHSGTFNKTIEARSLTGSGVVQNSIVVTGTTGGTRSTATLVLNTLATTDATFSGVLQDGSGTDSVLNLTVTGSGQQTLTGDNTYSGTTLVSAGTLIIDGAHSGAGLVTVEAGGLLGGNGSVAGSLIMLAGADFIFSLTETLTVNGASVSFGGFGISNLIGLDASVGVGTYTLIDGTAGFDFANVSNFGAENAVSIGDGKSAYFQAGSLQVVVVPEPASAFLLILGAAGLWGVRRRARKEATHS